MDDDDDLMPAEDICAGPESSYWCRKTRAEHTGWEQGGPSHEFVAPARTPKAEVCVSAHIQTDWTCCRCGAECDVWGEADAWMECDKCGRYSYLVPFMNVPALHE